jgi:hypothetical protein
MFSIGAPDENRYRRWTQSLFDWVAALSTFPEE